MSSEPTTNPTTTPTASPTEGPVRTGHLDGVTTITLDDGKVNALSPAMQAAIHAALDRAGAAGGPVVLTGRPGVFSAGFDLGVLTAGGTEAAEMVAGGFELALRLLDHPDPVIIGCTGHAIAMGSFLLCSGDLRIGASGRFRVQANEVAIGLTVPHAALAVLSHRLTPAALSRVTTLAEPLGPDEAVAAGFLDRLVPPDQLEASLRAAATAAIALDGAAHTATKRRLRAPALEAIRSGLAADRAALAAR